MPSKEYSGRGPEQGSLSSVIKDIIASHKAGIAKRTSRLLNPLDDHNFLSTMGIGTLPSPEEVAGQSGYFSPRSAERHFHKARNLKRTHPHRFNEGVIELTEQGISLLSDVGELHQSRIGANGDPIKRIDAEVKEDGTEVKGANAVSSLRGHIKSPAAGAAMDLLNIVIDNELFKVREESPAYSPEEQKILLAAAIGTAQAVVVSELVKVGHFKIDTKIGQELSDKRLRNQKISVRDYILNYAFQRVRSKGEVDPVFNDVLYKAGDIPDYFRIQKELELLFKGKDEEAKTYLYAD